MTNILFYGISHQIITLPYRIFKILYFLYNLFFPENFEFVSNINFFSENVQAKIL